MIDNIDKIKRFIKPESTGNMECKVTFVDKDSILNAYPLENIK